jgi:hypothetical protein
VLSGQVSPEFQFRGALDMLRLGINERGEGYFRPANSTDAAPAHGSR